MLKPQTLQFQKDAYDVEKKKSSCSSTPAPKVVT